MKILLRIPTPYGAAPETEAWLRWLVSEGAPNGRYRDHIIDADMFFCGFGPAEAHNEILIDFRASGADVLWLIDHDVVPPKRLDIIDRLAEYPIIDRLAEYPVVAGWYYGASFLPGGRMNLFPHVYRRQGAEAWEVWERRFWPSTDTFIAEGAATGCMLIRRNIFEKMDKRPFEYRYNPHGEKGILTDDLVFCNKLAGVMIDQTYACEHVRRIPLGAVAKLVNEAGDVDKDAEIMKDRLKALGYL